MAFLERMTNICHKTKCLHTKICLIICIFLILTPGVIHTSHNWPPFSQFDNIINPLTFNQNNLNKQTNNNNNNDNNKKIDNQNTGSVKHFNYRHIALGSGSQVSPRQGSWKKWISQPSPLSSS